MNPGGDERTEVQRIVHRHLRFGWWCLLLFLTMGIALEGLHGFKVRLYMDVVQGTRRLMWTLSHAHGTLLALINIAFAVSLPALGAAGRPRLAIASGSLLAAGLLLPAGFFLGGLFTFGGDPGVGIVLIPLGAAALVAGVAITAWATR